jgi:MraZ protein
VPLFSLEIQNSGGKWWKVVKNYIRLLRRIPHLREHKRPMTFFTSEYESKLDAKGRLVLPARIKAQLPAQSTSEPHELVIRRGFEQCLILYPVIEFKKIFSKISGLNEFNEENRKLQRNFLSGVVTVELDGNGRFLLPKNMLTYAKIDKDAMLVGLGSKVEIWNPEIYRNQMINDPGELSKLAEKHLNDNG